MHASTRRHRLPPSASIAPAVEALFVNELTGDAPLVSIPRPEIELTFRFGPAAPRGLDAHALGARQRVRRKVVRGVRRTVTARLRLGASEAVLGVPASAIAGRIVAFVDLWGDEATRPRGRPHLGRHEGVLAAQPELGLPRVPGGRAFAATGRVSRAWVA